MGTSIRKRIRTYYTHVWSHGVFNRHPTALMGEGPIRGITKNTQIRGRSATGLSEAASAASGKHASPRAHPVSQLDCCVLVAIPARWSSAPKSGRPPTPHPWVPLVTTRGGWTVVFVCHSFCVRVCGIAVCHGITVTGSRWCVRCSWRLGLRQVPQGQAKGQGARGVIGYEELGGFPRVLIAGVLIWG